MIREEKKLLLVICRCNSGELCVYISSVHLPVGNLKNLALSFRCLMIYGKNVWLRFYQFKI